MIGERILHMMDDMEISIKGLSAATGIRQRELHDIVAGITQPHGRILRKIAEALGAEPDDICGMGTERRYLINRADLGNTYDAIDEYVRCGAAFC